MGIRILFVFSLCLLFTGFSEDGDTLIYKDIENADFRSINNKAFKAGEKSAYLVHYGPIDAGTAYCEIKRVERKLNTREMLHIVGKGKSEGLLDVFFHVDDTYETFIDEDGVFPWLFLRRIHEGGYELSQTYKFYQNIQKVETQKGVRHDVPPAVQDMFSAAFYARTLNLKNLKVGDTVTVKSFVDDEIFDLKIRYGGTDVITIRSGKYRCMKFNPVIHVGKLFNTAEDLEVWISDDENKLPILCKASILVGSVKVEIINYSGLSNPLAKLPD